MKRIFFTSVAALFILTTANSFADDTSNSRTIEESLVYDDPTVAKENQWAKGFSIDYVTLSQNLSISNSPNPNITGTEKYQQPGISAFITSGDLTLLASYRSGSGNFGFTAPMNGYGTLTGNDALTTSEYEVDLRWLLTGIQTHYFTPYIIGGYAGSTQNQTLTINGISGTFALSDTSTAPLVGIGGIITFDKFGIRIDDKVGFVSDSSQGSTTTYHLNRLTATMYYKFADSWNAQFGASSDSYNNGSASLTALYAMLGYSYK